MAFSFILHDLKLFAFLQSPGNEFQTIVHLDVKLFRPCLVLNCGGLNSELQSDLIVTENTLLKRVVS